MVMLLGAVVNNGVAITAEDTVNKNVWVCPKVSVIARVVLPAFSKLRVKVPPLDDPEAEAEEDGYTQGYTQFPTAFRLSLSRGRSSGAGGGTRSSY